MIPEISFFAEGIPKGQPRPRATHKNGFTRMYDPGTAAEWKSAIALAAKPHRPAQPLMGAVKVIAMHVMHRPLSHFKPDGSLRKGAPADYTKKPDLDNLAKCILDALTQLGFWRDDAQVTECTVMKRYCRNTEAQGAQIIVAELA